MDNTFSEVHFEGDTIRCKVHGVFDAMGSEKFRKNLEGYLEPEVRFISIDMQDVQYADSHGIAIMVQLRKTLATKGITVQYINPSQTLQKTLGGFKDSLFKSAPGT